MTPFATHHPRLGRSGLLACIVFLACSLSGIGLAPAAEPVAADEIDLAEILRKPEYGNYRGYAEFKMAHYDSARRIWEALDQRNFGEAAFNLGIFYEDGLGVGRDIERAMAYYRRGALLGSPKAMFRAGVMYWLGAPGVAADRGEGRRYLSMAAAAGDSEAQRYLAAESAGADADDPVLRADRALAAQWFGSAAQAGDGEAMYALAVMHATGAGRDKDPALAEEWLQRSAAAGYPAAIADLKRRVAAR